MRLKRSLHLLRDLYNELRAKKIEAYRKNGISLTKTDLRAIALQKRKENGVLQSIHSQVVQNVADRVHTGFKNYFEKRARFPRVKKHQIEIARVISSLSNINGFERLRKEAMYTNSRLWNRRIARTDWRGIARRVKGVGCSVAEPSAAITPYTSKTCSRCVWINRDLRGAVFECKVCELRLSMQLNGAINLYLKMEGVPHKVEWWDENILPTLVGG